MFCWIVALRRSAAHRPHRGAIFSQPFRAPAHLQSTEPEALKPMARGVRGERQKAEPFECGWGSAPKANNHRHLGRTSGFPEESSGRFHSVMGGYAQ